MPRWELTENDIPKALRKSGKGNEVEGGPIDDVVVTDFGVIHGEAVVMFGGDDEILHASGFGEGDPRFGVEVDGVELMGAFAIFGDGDVEALHDPFGFGVRGDLLAFPFAGEGGVRAPVDEHAEFVVAEPSHAVGGGRGGLGGEEGEGRKEGEGGEEMKAVAHDES